MGWRQTKINFDKCHCWPFHNSAWFALNLMSQWINGLSITNGYFSKMALFITAILSPNHDIFLKFKSFWKNKKYSCLPVETIFVRFQKTAQKYILYHQFYISTFATLSNCNVLLQSKICSTNFSEMH